MGLLSLFARSDVGEAGGAVPLTAAAPGSRLRVESIAADRADRSDRLASLGVVAGCEIVLRQRRPVFVVEVGETTLALDPAIARGIRVLPA